MFQTRNLAICVLAVTTVGAASAGYATAATVTAGNLIASVNEFTGSILAPKYVAEYTTGGTRVQILANVPRPGATGENRDATRDLVLGPGNAIHVYNGTFDAHLARLDLDTLTWTQERFSGWSTTNSVTYGGLDRRGQYIYATDRWTQGGEPQGVVRFDTSGGPPVRFAEGLQPIDLDVAGGVVYALEGDTVGKFDATTLVSLGVFKAGDHSFNRAIGVATDGSVLIGSSGGRIMRYSATGVLLDTLIVPGASFGDIDIDPSN